MAVSERLFAALCAEAKKNRIPLLTSLLVGAVTYFFCFTNKLENIDDMACLFGQGDTVASGRWGLELMEKLYPASSVPWLNGIVSLLLLSAAICVIVRMFRIQSPLLSALLAALLVSFPSQVCTFGYMFTAVPYALALLLAVCSAERLSRELTRGRILAAVLLLMCSLSLYQVYVAAAASLLVVDAFSRTLRGEENGRAILRRGGAYVLCLAAAMGIYYAVTAAVRAATGTELSEYAEGNLGGIGGILFGIRVAYTSFVGYFYKGYYDLVPTALSKSAHLAAVLVTAVLLGAHFRKRENRSGGRLWVALLCLALLPAAVNCVRIISTLFHNLMLFSFTSVYVLAAVTLEVCGAECKKIWRNGAVDLLALCMLAAAGTNIGFANRVYTKMYMQFEQAETFYTSVIAQVMQLEGYTADSPLCIVGSNEIFYDVPLADTEQFAGITNGIIGTYGQANFIRAYLGLHLNVAGWDVTDALAQDPRVVEMPSYPANGSIQNIDGYYVVKLG